MTQKLYFWSFAQRLPIAILVLKYKPKEFKDYSYSHVLLTTAAHVVYQTSLLIAPSFKNKCTYKVHTAKRIPDMANTICMFPILKVLMLKLCP